MATLSLFASPCTFQSLICRQCSVTRQHCKILTQSFMETMKYLGCHILQARKENSTQQILLSKNFSNLLSRILVCTSAYTSCFLTDLYIDFPSEPDSAEPSFELPRTQGVNDSYETYISQVCQDPSTQRTIIEEILDSYGSQPIKDISLAGLTQGWFQIELQYLCLISNLREQRIQHTFLAVHNSTSNKHPLGCPPFLNKTLKYRRKI